MIKKLLSIGALLFSTAIHAQAVSVNIINPSSSLPSVCKPYSVRVSSSGISICNSSGNGWNTAASASGAVTSVTGTANQITVTGTNTPTLALAAVSQITTSLTIGEAANSYPFSARKDTTGIQDFRIYNGATAATNNEARLLISVNNSFSGFSTAAVAARSINGGNSGTSLIFYSRPNGGGAMAEVGSFDNTGKFNIVSVGTATATAGAATSNVQIGTVTSESLTTAAGSAYTLTLTNSLISSTSKIFPSFANGTNTQGTLSLGEVTAGSGSATIVIRNIHASQSLNGSIKINFLVF